MSLLEKLFGRKSDAIDDQQACGRHPRFNPVSFYIELDASEIEALPIVEIDREQLYDIQCEWAFTTLDRYPHEFSLLAGEVGYDAQVGARYILRLTT